MPAPRATVMLAMLEISGLLGQVMFFVTRGRVALRSFADIGQVAPAAILSDYRSRSDNRTDTKVRKTGDSRLMHSDRVLLSPWVGHRIGGQPWCATHFGKNQKIAAMLHQMHDQPVQRLIQRARRLYR